MPFTKETAKALGKKGGKANVANKHNLWEFIASGGRDAYNQKLEKLQNGKKLSSPEKEFMDRVEKLFPYVKPKLASIEQKTELSGGLNITVAKYED